MHLEVLVEEQSAEEALRVLIPRILPGGISFKVHPFQGKRHLLSSLDARLRGYARWISTADIRVVVLVDADSDDCLKLKSALERAAEAAHLPTLKTAQHGEPAMVLTRVAVEELEAWFFGDCEAIRTAYPRVSKRLEYSERYRDPDAIRGGTWEALERVLQRAGYHEGGLPKIAVASAIAEHMLPARNRSRSFRTFCSGLKAL